MKLKYIILGFCLLVASVSFAAELASPTMELKKLSNWQLELHAKKKTSFLESSAKAFNFSVRVLSHSKLQATWVIAKGVYLYRDKVLIKLISPKKLQLKTVVFPATGTSHCDQFYGCVCVYRNKVTVLIRLNKAIMTPLKLFIRYQGCSDRGVCYPPGQFEVIADMQQIGQSAKIIDVPPQYFQKAKPILQQQPTKGLEQSSFVRYCIIIAALIFIVLAIWMGALRTDGHISPWVKCWRGIAILILVYSVAVLIASIAGLANPFLI